MRRLAPGEVARCVRCHSVLTRHAPHTLHRTAALSLAALALYFPANAFPILILKLHGHTSVNTVWTGVTRLWADNDYFISIIVFLASMLIPFLKLIGLFALVVSTRFHWSGLRLARTWMFKLIEGIGRWAMLDVFVLAVLVSLVKLQGLATILPGARVVCVWRGGGLHAAGDGELRCGANLGTRAAGGAIMSDQDRGIARKNSQEIVSEAGGENHSLR